MGRPVYTKLIITAFVTSIAFGGFAALNFYIFRELIPRVPTGEKVLHIRPDDGPHTPPIHILPNSDKRLKRPFFPLATGYNSELFIVGNSLFMTGAMLVVWLINIGIRLFNKRKLIRYTCSYVLVGLLLVTINYFGAQEHRFTEATPPGMRVHIRPTPTYGVRVESGQLSFMTAVVINTIVLAILELILVQHHKSEIELENTRLKMNHLLARYQHLQHQLQPHFLFNSLNTLKSLIRTSSDAAEEYLLRLSFFLRSSLAKNELALIPLAEEWQLCSYFLEMQKIRYGNAFHYSMQVPDDVLAAVQVPAFSLQLLVENAIKHNALTIEKPLHIQIAYSDGYICVKNNKQVKAFTEPSSSIGLTNLSERYRMISGTDIEVINEEHHFIVKIKALKK
jgi:hypothetical protein